MPGHARLLEKIPSSAPRGAREAVARTHARVRVLPPAPPAGAGVGVPPAPGGVGEVRALQRLVGNRAVMRMLDARRPVQALEQDEDEVQPAAVQALEQDEDEVQPAAVQALEQDEDEVQPAAVQALEMEKDEEIDEDRFRHAAVQALEQDEDEVQRAAVQPLEQDEDEVQRAAFGGGEPSAPAIRAAAAEGVRTPSAPLPFLGRIQASFGRHSVERVQAHTGPGATRASRAMNARAYASGDHVVFGGAPDLRTAAHEAAHVVQQRAGVQLAGGVGRTGDPYERHADAVADAVVAGKPAEGLLEPFSTPDREDRPGTTQRTANDLPVQRTITVDTKVYANADELAKTLKESEDVEWDDEYLPILAKLDRENAETTMQELLSKLPSRSRDKGEIDVDEKKEDTPDSPVDEDLQARLKEAGLTGEQIDDLVRREVDPDALDWVAGFGKTKFALGQEGKQKSIAHFIAEKARKDDIAASDIRMVFDMFEPLKGVKLPNKRKVSYDVWDALAAYYLKGKDQQNVYYDLKDKQEDQPPEVRAAMKLMEAELKPRPKAKRGGGGRGTLFVTGDDEAIEIGGRPAFEKGARELPGMREGFHRRHILAWHTIRAGTEKVVNRLLEKGMDPGGIDKMFTAFLERLKVKPSEKPDETQKRHETIEIALSALNSNVRNLWPGGGYQNSLINLYQQILRGWAAELKGKDELEVRDWYEKSGSIKERISGKQASDDPNAGRYAAAIGELAEYVDRAVLGYREDSERARTPRLDEIRLGFQALEAKNPAPQVKSNLDGAYTWLSENDFDLATFTSMVKEMKWTEQEEEVRNEVIGMVRRRHFFDVDQAARGSAGDELAARLLTAADNLEVDFAYEGAATPRRFARGKTRGKLEDHMQEQGLSWGKDEDVAKARQDPGFEAAYEAARDNVGRFLGAVEKMLAWAETGPEHDDPAELESEFEAVLGDLMGLE